MKYFTAPKGSVGESFQRLENGIEIRPFSHQRAQAAIPQSGKGSNGRRISVRAAVEALGNETTKRPDLDAPEQFPLTCRREPRGSPKVPEEGIACVPPENIGPIPD